MLNELEQKIRKAIPELKPIKNLNIMIQANELRLGNLVYVYNKLNNEKIVNKVDVSDLQLLTGQLKSPIEIKPILLNEEFLLKLGFKKYSKGVYELVLDSKLDNNLCAFLSDNDLCHRVDYCKGISPMIRFHCQSVHSLQNIFFALTNQELKINL